MRYRNPVRSVFNGFSTAIVLIGLLLALTIQPFNLPIFFVALAFSALLGSFGSLNPRGILGGIQGFMWLLILALCFATDNWLLILVGAAISAILGALSRPIIAMLLGLGIFGAASMANRQQQQPYYQPSQQQPYYQPPQQPLQPYQEGYQPPQPQPQSYEEGPLLLASLLFHNSVLIH